MRICTAQILTKEECEKNHQTMMVIQLSSVSVSQDLVNSLNAASDAKRTYHTLIQRRFQFVVFVKLASNNAIVY